MTFVIEEERVLLKIKFHVRLRQIQNRYSDDVKSPLIPTTFTVSVSMSFIKQLCKPFI